MIKKRLDTIRESIPAHVELIAVSKTKPNADIMEAYDAGQRHFGENKVQEMVDKHEALPKDIKWHLIGHLQTNKVKYIASFVHLIHAVDSLKLLKEINKQALKHDRVIPCLLQFYIAEEETKFGLDLKEAIELLESDEFKRLQNIQIDGVMGMATFSDDNEQIRTEFKNLKNIFNRLEADYFKSRPNFNIISMGMSSDYKIAIEEGSTMIRVGGTIFGQRG